MLAEGAFVLQPASFQDMHRNEVELIAFPVNPVQGKFAKPECKKCPENFQVTASRPVRNTP